VVTNPEFVLPDYAHLPGANARHEEGFLDHVIETIPDSVSETNIQGHAAWNYTLSLIEHGYFWEAHEVLEAMWMRAPMNSREKSFFKLMIQIVNAELKVKLMRNNAVKRLCEQAEESLEQVFGKHHSATLLGYSHTRISKIIHNIRQK